MTASPAATEAEPIPDLVLGLLDDASVFPPGSSDLPEAIAAHLEYRHAWYTSAVGPLVLPESALLRFNRARADIAIAVTFPQGPAGLSLVMDAAGELNVRAIELTVPVDADVNEMVSAVETSVRDHPVEVAIEVPRDQRRDQVLARIARTGFRAKLRTGGVRAHLYPDEAELASTIAAVLGAGVPFKATAGLHHAIRNTDPQTGFEQHGFLNLMLAVDAALDHAPAHSLIGLLADRDGSAVAKRISAWDSARTARARRWFTSFGTCSIDEPLTELHQLGLVGPPPKGRP